MLKRYITLLTLLITVTACATAQNYENMLNREIGQSSNALINKFGAPTSVKRFKNGDEIITYTHINNQVVPSPNYYFNTDFMTEDEMFAPFTYGGNAIPVGNFMGEVITEYCQTKFYLKNNIVTSWQYKGNACVAM